MLYFLQKFPELGSTLCGIPSGKTWVKMLDFSVGMPESTGTLCRCHSHMTHRSICDTYGEQSWDSKAEWAQM